MPRPAKFSHDQILDGAREACLVHWRDTTVAHVAAEVGAPVGSIYHRFSSRDALFGALWSRSIRRFHVGLLEASELTDPTAGMAALARHIPRFCRDHPGDAKAMTLYRLPDLIERLPDQAERLAGTNAAVDAALRRLTALRYGRFTERRYRLALVGTRQAPYGLLRPLIGGPIPPDFDAICVAAAEGVLALGD